MTSGQHLVVDCDGVDPARLEDASRMRDLLTRLATDCGLTICSGPHLVPFTPVGLTGFVVLRESHAAFHTYPERGALALDVYSCAPLSRRRVLATVREVLAPGRVRSRLLRRGLGKTTCSPLR